MREVHLTLRLSRDLAKALSRWARTHGVAKSQIVREAVEQYVGIGAPKDASAEVARPVPGRAAAARWASLPHLTAEEAGGLAGGIAASRTGLPSGASPGE